MANIGLFFGSTTGSTANAAEMIKKEFGSEIKVPDQPGRLTTRERTLLRKVLL